MGITIRQSVLALAVGVVLHGTAVADPALTIYNQDFAVVRETIPLDLQEGVNSLRFADTTAHVEPDSVMLRDPEGRHALQILEQNYRADPICANLTYYVKGQRVLYSCFGRARGVSHRCR